MSDLEVARMNSTREYPSHQLCFPFFKLFSAWAGAALRTCLWAAQCAKLGL